MTAEELKNEPEYELVDGRSGMNKEQLVAAMTTIRNDTDPASMDDSDSDDSDSDDSDSEVDEVEVEEADTSSVDLEDDRGTGPGALSGSSDSGEREYDENYLGTAPEYQTSANASTAPMASDEGDEANEIVVRVRQMEEDNASVGPGKQTFEEWTGNNPSKLSNQVTHADKS